MQYHSKTLDHLGLVAAMYDELEIGQVIDRLIPQDFDQRIVTIGEATKAMVLNGLGFVNQRLYLVPRFFETKPTGRLIREGILPEHLNDDTLGRSLDALYEAGVTEVFRAVAAHAALRLDLESRFGHIDSTSFHVDGTYNSEAEAPEEGVIHIRTGYSRDHRPELNQVVLDLIVEQQAGLPLLMKPLSGNSSDQADFPRLIRAHIAQLQQAHGIDYFVGDCALYNADHIRDLAAEGVKFITRVPETINEAKAAIAAVNPDAMQSLMREDGSLSEGYRYVLRHSGYGEVEQRWLVIFSEVAQGRAQKSVAAQIERQHKKEQKAFKKLMKRDFSCREDAWRALEAFDASLAATTIEEAKLLECQHFNGGGGEITPTDEVSYRIRGEAVVSRARQAKLIARKSMFILATNELDEEALPAEQVLSAYKGQAKVERGFRFLKDPVFLASSLFLKNEKRIMALLMVMTICLLVYAALEWRIRQGLKQQGQSIPDQKGKPTQRPTARWVFYSFEGIHVLLVGRKQLVLNLQERHEVVLAVLGERYQSKYQSHSP